MEKVEDCGEIYAILKKKVVMISYPMTWKPLVKNFVDLYPQDLLTILVTTHKAYITFNQPHTQILDA